jgi:hypothetical protein
MDEKYVQEHILTGGIVAPVGGASPTHSWPLRAISLGVVASYRHICGVLRALRIRGPRCGWLRVSWLHRHRKPPRLFEIAPAGRTLLPANLQRKKHDGSRLSAHWQP